jgi:hypothetical protein
MWSSDGQDGTSRPLIRMPRNTFPTFRDSVKVIPAGMPGLPLFAGQLCRWL